MKTISISEVRNGEISRYVDHFRFENDAEAQKFMDTFNKVYVQPAGARPSRYLMAVTESRPLR